MDSISPVLTATEVTCEEVIALDQPEYFPVIVLRTCYIKDDLSVDFSSYVRFRFSEAERAFIARGADLLVSQPHHGPLMPIALQLAMPGEYPAPVAGD